jgi:hypothetical protein
VARSVSFYAGLVLYALGWTDTEPAVALNPCPRPTDQYGPRSEAVSGTYRLRGTAPGGGKFLTIVPRNGAAPVSVNVTDRIFDTAGSLKFGTHMTIVSYVRDSMSGAQPPYSCIELTR